MGDVTGGNDGAHGDGGPGGVRRERLLLAGTAALTVLAPLAVWRIGRMAPRGERSAAPEESGDDPRSEVAATRTARAGTKSGIQDATPVPASVEPAAEPRRKRRGDDATPEIVETSAPPSRKRRRDSGTPTAQP